MKAQLDISNDLWVRFVKEEPEFSETVLRAKQLCEAWWTREGRVNLSSKNFNYRGWGLQMRNRFSWDKNDQAQEKELNINITRRIVPGRVPASSNN